jgi:dTDP-4-dehydrorhamnose reductase
MRVAVVGARGQLGAAVALECQRQYEVIPFNRSDLDVTDASAVTDALDRARADVIVNCTGYNAVDDAETHPVEALSINGLAVRSMARTARDLGAVLVHYGSDFVFDGRATKPYVETDQPNPQSAYATSKLLGEWFAVDAPRVYVLRVESLFGGVGASSRKGSLYGIVNALKTGRVPKVIGDRTVSPTFVIDAARATLEIVERQAASGLYHCVNGGQPTWLDVAEEAARLLGVEPRFDVVRFNEIKLPAARPKYCALSNAKLAAVGINMPTWQDALRRYILDVK